MAAYTYPPAPAGASDELVKPSPLFRREVRKVIAALSFFGLLYLIIIAASVALTLVLGMAGIWIVISIHNLWAILFGVGIAGVGLMVLAFVLKFIFAKKTETNKNYDEISEEEYPDLFAFIRQVSEETHTPFPKHIYLSPEVNAAVFYDSSFWSMIFPVRKNLVIGLGLVNMTNLSEFKSVIAHEFGHFSQKSMRAGSYVYHANKVLYNMLYENNGYAEALQRWASIHGLFAICAKATARIVRTIQWILQQAYKVVNRQYMSLSRQMEFHADAMSAKVAGANNAIHALRRIDFADDCYRIVINRYNQWLPENLKGSNVFSQQRIAASYMAVDHKFQMAEGLPLLHDADHLYRTYNRVKLGQQWASHPSREQREEALNALQVTAPVISESAWVLFPDAIALQEKTTRRLYEGVAFEAATVELDDALFLRKSLEEREKYVYPAFYEGYYNGRGIQQFQLQEPAGMSRSVTDLSAFFEEGSVLCRKIEAMKEDIQLLDQITDAQHDIRTFDFDGARHNRKEVPRLKAMLEEDIRQAEASLKQRDEQAYRHFLHLAQLQDPQAAEALTQAYQACFRIDDMGDENYRCWTAVAEAFRPFNDSLTVSQAAIADAQLREKVKAFQERLRMIHAEFGNVLDVHPMPEALLALKEKHYCFINEAGNIHVDLLNEVWQAAKDFSEWTSMVHLRQQKALLEQQLRLLPHQGQ